MPGEVARLCEGPGSFSYLQVNKLARYLWKQQIETN